MRPLWPKRLGMVPETVQAMAPASSASTTFWLGMPERVTTSSASSTEVAVSMPMNSKSTAPGSCATQRDTSGRPAGSVSMTGPHTVCSTTSVSQPPPRAHRRSSIRSMVRGPSGPA